MGFTTMVALDAARKLRQQVHRPDWPGTTGGAHTPVLRHGQHADKSCCLQVRMSVWQGHTLGYNFAPHGRKPSAEMVLANLTLSGQLPYIATVHVDQHKVRHEQSIYLPS